ncbi:carbohydrate binding protein with CBM6 domain [Dyadobacter jejuensis]|uniref:Carbohydrate binding protein with CBM6 domain n=1 Tax=Dyadobacter jejuensis TaxID=1082580 RepID=A0A316A3S5_9BACT|nr:carbohydrate-binding protein [Dyadobacter jejuensis]PWJ52626.1 carbohydrate binding protein with CBM6 domain [Dyadobacter jejuensis]
MSNSISQACILRPAFQLIIERSQQSITNASLSFRVANSFGNGIIEIQNSTGQLLGQVNVPQTDGWQVYTTIETTVNLPSGSQIIRLFANKGTFNFNWFEVVEGGITAKAKPTISFASLPIKGLGDADFELNATTENQETGLSMSSSDPCGGHPSAVYGAGQ